MTAPQSQNSGLWRILFGAYINYARRIIPIFILCCFLFVFSLGMGYLLGDTIPTSTMDDLLGSLPDTSNMTLPELFAFIAVNNIGKSLLFMSGGVIGGVLPLFFVIFNGFFIGYIAYSLGSIFGITYIIAGLTPHGVFEIPAIVFAMAVGMNLGYAAMNALRGEGSIWKEARLALGLFLTRITPILLIAAVIEVTLTPLLLAWLGYI
ncbi:hypothetical protein EG829_30880 [bacterium]|nr:hypothetical protein [bacterium]